MTIEAAAKSGDHRRALEAMRDKLARDMDEAPPAVVAQIAGRLAAILQELVNLPGEEKSASDELARRRASRRSTSDVVKPSTRKA